MKIHKVEQIGELDVENGKLLDKGKITVFITCIITDILII